MKEQKDLQKLEFLILVIVAFSLIYFFGPKVTGFAVSDGAGTNVALVTGLVGFLIIVTLIVVEIIVRLR